MSQDTQQIQRGKGIHSNPHLEDRVEDGDPDLVEMVLLGEKHSLFHVPDADSVAEESHQLRTVRKSVGVEESVFDAAGQISEQWITGSDRSRFGYVHSHPQVDARVRRAENGLEGAKEKQASDDNNNQ